MKRKSLIHKSMSQFVVCVAVLFMLAAPLFYWLTKNYYAEDMADLREAIEAGTPPPADDLESDIVQGIMLQYLIITATFGIAVVLTMRLISKRLWRPFDKTLESIEAFRLEDGKDIALPDTDINEFARLNSALMKLTANSMASYRAQKEFTENASHELQTPLAIFQTKLDLLMQQPEMTARQAEIIQDLGRMNARLTRLNRNLLLLAKIDNSQFSRTEDISLTDLLSELLPNLESIAAGLSIEHNFGSTPVRIKANRTLTESLVNNLVVNAVRHNREGGKITITATPEMLEVANTSDEPALDAEHIFNRFYRPKQNEPGNGLGLAIVKAICQYHGWTVAYRHEGSMHKFCVKF